jgi:hypothetical protein
MQQGCPEGSGSQKACASRHIHENWEVDQDRGRREAAATIHIRGRIVARADGEVALAGSRIPVCAAKPRDRRRRIEWSPAVAAVVCTDSGGRATVALRSSLRTRHYRAGHKQRGRSRRRRLNNVVHGGRVRPDGERAGVGFAPAVPVSVVHVGEIRRALRVSQHSLEAFVNAFTHRVSDVPLLTRPRDAFANAQVRGPARNLAHVPMVAASVRAVRIQRLRFGYTG